LVNIIFNIVLIIQKSLDFNFVNCRFAKGNIDEEVKGVDDDCHGEIYDDG